MKELERKKDSIVLVYSIQAQLLMNKIKDFSIDEFEKDYADKLIIGDKTISKYILEKETTKLKQETKNGSKRK